MQEYRGKLEKIDEYRFRIKIEDIDEIHNSRSHRKLSWDDIRTLPEKYFKKLESLAVKYGYLEVLKEW